jgi:UDP-N-acetylglucosamine 2-epimerase
MKVLRVHAPGVPGALAERVGRAVADFNRGLDIRLRFLSIGIDESVIAVEGPGAADAVTASMETRPDVIVVLGDGAEAVAAATSASRAGIAVVRVGAGRRGGTDPDAARAVDRLAAVLLVHDAAAARALASEGAAGLVVDVGAEDDPSAAVRIVEAVSRARSSARGGWTGGA